MNLARNIKLLKWLVMPVVILYFSCRHGGLPWMEAGKEAGGDPK
jgi:hypothetical protein